MEYFYDEIERKESGSTCYFEFQNGKFQDKHWLKDSLYLHADVFDTYMLYYLLSDVIKEFDYYGPNEVSKEQWNILVKKSEEKQQWDNIITELKAWVEECFQKYECFTICGI